MIRFLLCFLLLPFMCLANIHDADEPRIMCPIYEDTLPSQIFRFAMINLAIENMQKNIEKVEDPEVKELLNRNCSLIIFYLGSEDLEGD